jgi:hypothetical protein
VGPSAGRLCRRENLLPSRGIELRSVGFPVRNIVTIPTEVSRLPGMKYNPRYGGADKSLARATSRCILFDSENNSFDASLVIYINSTNIPPIMIINWIYEHQNLLSL